MSDANDLIKFFQKVDESANETELSVLPELFQGYKPKESKGNPLIYQACCN
ncbi:hypothetical protein [Peribacillus simplex]|uniref:hypothetical protein n=1 Tax=Peribacillus simplex TaxID=1478 RepID=UPI000AA9C60D|nr:hypothetical protein [Peribacillus simplex]MEC1399605.1 hypothetical protein [Peribacillus simplex]MED3909238.1 hypothetical protein [Peribacillus simplex]MED3982678.1 hypothetical protein [Peribacillus simplex]MED4096008.1 hypothetical protein [Peribacillus simplex]CAH0205042.1 hypothetical protein SRABI84_01995 [Peribacillus simplex]